ncbi:MAG: type VI secretion system membrane subunit TssM [Pseudomonadota bacterium]|nr:type VI secretion system membrane subunit TssM [Pseudomonadota bacterium]
MIKTLFGLVFNRWVLLAVLLLALSFVIWVVGPIFGLTGPAGTSTWRPLESESARWVAIAAIVALFALIIAWRAWRARRGNSAVVKQLLASPASEKGEADSADMAAVRQRFEKALLTLRRARFGAGGGTLAGWKAKLNGRYLYELPWYLIIGAPGSGKTTALRHSGLKFPLASAGSEDAIRGVGGTRNCDWWFTDQAVLIDTAGRFTTQDSDRENDRATWSGFLAMLKRSRPRQPVNGVLVTVSVSDLLTRSLAERREYAATVRQRLLELHEGLGIRFPIYLLVTKSDLLAGFTDYFATIDKEQRATPWGATFPIKEGPAQNLQRFGQEFDLLVQRLENGLIDRLQSERDPQKRTRIYGFAGQFAGLRGVLQEFLEVTFSSSPYEADALLRGVYFVSGTQEGTPIDRVLGSIARSYRLERAIIAPNQASGRSYFLSRLLGEVVFAESGLANTDLKWERRRSGLVIAAYAAVGAITVGALAAWAVSYANNRRYIDEVSQRVSQVRQLVQTTPNRASPDLLPILPALKATRELAGTGNEVPRKRGFGLNQEPKLDSAARASYQRMLVDAMLPRIGLRVEEQLRQASTASETQYEALKAYLMLHDVQHFDPDALRIYLENDWDVQFGRSLSTEDRERLDGHLTALLAGGAAVSPLAEDQALVDFHRSRLSAVTLPQRIYDRMRQRGLGKDFPEFTVVRAAGNDAALAFVRLSGAPLTKGVPGLFTYDGYHKGFQGAVKDVAQQLADEQGWVLGVKEPPKDAATTIRGGEPLLDEVRRIYLNEYASRWDAFIADVRLVPTTSLAQLIQTARLLSSADSPLPRLMTGMSHQTTLLSADSKNVIEKTADRATGVVKGVRDSIASRLTPQQTQAGPPIESIVDDRFAGLRRYVSAPEGGGKPPIDDTMALIAEVQVMLNAADEAIKGGGAPQPSPVPVKVKTEAQRLPEPARSMMDALGDSSARISQVMVRQNLSNEVRSQVGEFCQQAIAGRYPVDRNSARDATPADFAMLFGPGGKIDQLVQTRLAPYIDTTKRPWKFRPVEGAPLGTDSGTLVQFQRAQAIRETFFPGVNVPTFRLQIKPVDMDASLKQFILDVDGQIVRYDHGPQIPTPVVWPGPRGTMQVRVEVNPPGSGTTFGSVFEGPWALLRLFDRVTIDPIANSQERFRATFDVDGRKAIFDITASSVRNPFRLPELHEFQCPMGL